MLPGAEADAVEGLAGIYSVPEFDFVDAFNASTDDAPVARGRSACAVDDARFGESHATSRNPSRSTNRSRKSLLRDDLRGNRASAACDRQMSPAGFELAAARDWSVNDLRRSEKSGGAKSGAVLSDSGSLQCQLNAVVAAWPTLPEAVRAEIFALVRR